MSKNENYNYSLNLKLSSKNLLIGVFLISTAGSLLQISGGSWDVTSHLKQLPETFFTPSHTVLYSGIGLLFIAAILSAYVLIKNKTNPTKISFALKLLIIGSLVSLVAGPFDFLWHQIFGLDGLLSPTHLALTTGMLINSMAATIGLIRILEYLPDKNEQKIIRIMMIPSFAAMWLTMIWYIYMFALPLSNGEHFNFNLNPLAQTIIAIVCLPLINSTIFITASKVIGKFGAATSVFAILLGINIITNILPVNNLSSFLPWYILLIVPALIADIIMNKSQFVKLNISSSKYFIVSGAIIGSFFYILGFPILPMTFANHFLQPNEILQFFNSFTILVETITSGTLVGAIGTMIISSKIVIRAKNSHKIV